MNPNETIILNAANSEGRSCKNARLSFRKLQKHISALRSIGWRIEENVKESEWTYYGRFAHMSFVAYAHLERKEEAA